MRYEPLPMLTLDELGLAPRRNFIHRILRGTPGIFATTGQSGTGKIISLCAIVLEAAPLMDLQVSYYTHNKHSFFKFPPNWTFVYVEDTTSSWEQAIATSLAESSNIIVVDLLNSNNLRPLLNASALGRWVFTCIDTPFLGADVVCNIYSWQEQNYRKKVQIGGILNHLSCIWSQILLPRICRNCGTLTTVAPEDARLIYPETTHAEQIWQEVGCDVCEQTGIKGRLPAYEILQIDDETRPLLQMFLERNIPAKLPAHKHLTMQNYARELVKTGKVGIGTYKREILQNPLLRSQHLLELEKYRSLHIQKMFGRFVTQQVANRIISDQDFEKIIEGENRRVTCFFCDIRDFTGLAERLSPAEIFMTINKYFEELIDIIFASEGTIDKFIGDSIMGVFGAPIEQLDHEIRAVQCAIAIQQKVAQINQAHTHHLPVQVGIGINTGYVMAGCLGSQQRMDYTVLGDTVNIAARFESLAKPGQILIGPETYSAVSEQVKCRAIGPLSLRGKSEKIDAFEVLYQQS
jgi:class 3 adenylate cyclase